MVSDNFFKTYINWEAASQGPANSVIPTSFMEAAAFYLPPWTALVKTCTNKGQGAYPHHKNLPLQFFFTVISSNHKIDRNSFNIYDFHVFYIKTSVIHALPLPIPMVMTVIFRRFFLLSHHRK